MGWTKRNPMCKAVRVIDLDKVFPSLTECALYIRGTKAGISNCLHGRQHTHRGYTFEFV